MIISCQKASIRLISIQMAHSAIIQKPKRRRKISRTKQATTINSTAATTTAVVASTAGNPPRCTAIYFSTHKIVERIVLVFSNIYRFDCFSLSCRIFFFSYSTLLSFFMHIPCIWLLLLFFCCLYSLCGRGNIVWLEFFTVMYWSCWCIQVNKSMMNLSLRKRGGAQLFIYIQNVQMNMYSSGYDAVHTTALILGISILIHIVS